VKRKRTKRQSLKEYQDEWYAILKEEGFQDIEDVSNPGRPLKEWHSRKFTSERSRIRQAERENYNKMIDNFINARSINEICAIIVKHGGCVLEPREAKRILELHRDGLPERKIAAKIKVSKKCVHLTLEKARTWMKLAS
jgi:hypothetical protein